MNIRLRRGAVLAIPLLVAACATGFPTERSLAVAVAADQTSPDSGTFDVTLTNISDQDRCVFNDVLARPGSDALNSGLRIGGQAVPHVPEGYVVPQVQGSRRLAPGETVSFKANLNWRFVRSFETLGRDAEARIGVPHTPCLPQITAGDWRTSWSPWTPIGGAAGFRRR